MNEMQVLLTQIKKQIKVVFEIFNLTVFASNL